MNTLRKTSTNLVMVLTTLSHLGLGSSASCAFGFSAFSDNRSHVPTWTIPVGEPFNAGDSVLNEGSTIVLYDDAGAAISCSGNSSQYLLQDGTWSTYVSFPAAPGVETEEFMLQGVFYANESDVMVDPPPAYSTVAFSDSLYGRTVQLNVTCTREDGSDLLASYDGDSCVRFEVNFTNYSPIPDTDIALYRFEEPAIPAFVLPPANLAVNMSPGDIQLNIDNPIVSRDGSDVPWGCNGDMADYLGEDGEWYDYYTGSDGNLYNLTHVFYATNTTHLNAATIQRVWSPNLEAALYNRTVRLLISCTNQVDFEQGYVFFKTGDESFYILCDTVPDLCSSLNTTSGAWRQASTGASSTFIAVSAATFWFAATWILNYIH